MLSLEYAKHARPSLGQALIYGAASLYKPALEAIVTGKISAGILREQEKGHDKSIRGLVGASAMRLAEMDRNKHKWNYTRRHSLEVGYFSYIIASEAKANGVYGSAEIDPELCFAGGFTHDIGKTFLPLALVVKELGVDLVGMCIMEGRQLNDNEREILRLQHIEAGKNFVSIFGPDCEGICTINDMVRLHHVMYNGRGSGKHPSYPPMAAGREVKLHSRIAKTSDFLSAVLPRHYRNDEWVISIKDSIGYAIAVAGIELDPITVRCYITGTHDVEAAKADMLIESLKYKGPAEDVGNFGHMRAYVKKVVETNAEFVRMLATRSIDKIRMYTELISECAGRIKAPTLEELPS